MTIGGESLVLHTGGSQLGKLPGAAGLAKELSTRLGHGSRVRDTIRQDRVGSRGAVELGGDTVCSRGGDRGVAGRALPACTPATPARGQPCPGPTSNASMPPGAIGFAACRAPSEREPHYEIDQAAGARSRALSPAELWPGLQRPGHLPEGKLVSAAREEDVVHPVPRRTGQVRADPVSQLA